MTKGGYVMIDCEGLDLLGGETPQEITGIYKKCQEALASGKAVFAQNCIWGEGLIVSPISVLLIQLLEDTIVATAATLQIWVTNEDVVTIQNLVAD